MTTQFHVLKEPPCFEDEAKHQTVEKLLASKHTTMAEVFAFIQHHGNNDVVYVIQKYIGPIMHWRRLKGGGVSTTWTRFEYNRELESWKESPFRYEDEIICH